MTSGSPLKRNVLSNAGSTAVATAVKTLLLSVLARTLDVTGLAGYLTAVAVVGVGEMASDFGGRVWAMRRFALPESRGVVFREAIGSKLFYSAAFALVLLLIPLGTLTPWQVALSFLIAVTQPSTDPLLWHLLGIERMDVEAVVSLVSQVAVALALAGLALSGSGLTALLGAWLTVNATRILVETRLPLSKGLARSGGAPPVLAVLGVIRDVFPMGAAFLLKSLYHRLGVISLGYLGDAHDVAVFGAAFTIVASSGFIATAIVVASFPRLAQAIAAKDWPGAVAVVTAKLALITWVMAPICLAGLVASPWIIRLVYGEAYAGAAPVMILMLPAIYLSCINWALKYLLNALGLNWIDAASALLGIAVFLGALSCIRAPLPERGGLAWLSAEVAVLVFGRLVLSRAEGLRGLSLGRTSIVTAMLCLGAWAGYRFHR